MESKYLKEKSSLDEEWSSNQSNNRYEGYSHQKIQYRNILRISIQNIHQIGFLLASLPPLIWDM